MAYTYSDTRRAAWARYSIAVLAAGGAVLARSFLRQWLLPDAPAIFSPLAVMFSAYFGGIGPGLVTTVLAGLGAAYFFLPPAGLAVGNFHDQVRLGLFAIDGLFISLLNEALHRARRRAEASAESLRRSNGELTAISTQLSAASAAKDRFLAVLSHELRTPLTPVLMTASTMERDPSLSEELREQAAMMRRNVELESRLIEDLLDVTRIANGKLHLRQERVEVNSVLRAAIDVCIQPLQQKGLRLRYRNDGGLHYTRGDAVRLQQAFWNLLRNAIKFTPEGGEISASIGRDASSERLVIEIADTGIGLEGEHLERLFRPFEQADAQITRTYGGLGLGLAITKGIVDLHGGVLSARSEGIGRGATFTIQLPTDAAEASEASAAPAAAKDSRSSAEREVDRRLRILVVDDHPDTLRILSRLLEGMDYEVSRAANVREALEIGQHGAFDLLISDLGLPDGTGCELLRELRKRSDLPGIVISGYGMEEDIRRTREAGFAEHLVKPVDVQRLQAAIKRAVPGCGSCAPDRADVEPVLDVRH